MLILGNSYSIFALPLSPSQQLGLVDDDYLSKASRLEELESKKSLSDKEREALASIRRELSSSMEEISYNKLELMVYGDDREKLLEVARKVKLSSFLVESLEEELKKSQEP